MQITKFPLVIILLSSYSVAHAEASSPIEEAVNDYLSQKKDIICKNYSSIPKDSCTALVEAAAKSAVGLDVDKTALKEAIKKDFNKPEYLNSALSKIFDDGVPIGLEFKDINSKNNGASVIGLTYNIDYDFYKSVLSESVAWRKQSSFAFQAEGTIVNDSSKNPRNFLETKLSAFNAYTTNIPQQSKDFADKLTDAALNAAQACAGAGASNTEKCKLAKEAPYVMLDSTSVFLKAYQRYEFGLNAGYETDQAFKAKQSALGVFAFGQYEDWGNNSWIAGLNVTPSFHFAVDKVNPNNETPRVKAGDTSDYYRFSGEISLWMPIGTYFDKNLVLTVNYRNYQELNPSAIVKNAHLNSYNLRTFSLTSPTGLFITYSSGRLPFEMQTDDVVELGWKTYF